MPAELIPWLVAAAVTAAGGVATLSGGRAARAGGRVAAGGGLGAALAGLGWRAWVTGVLPGYAPADALAMLAAGALGIALWSTFAAARPRGAAGGLTLLGVTALLVAAVAVAWRTPPPAVTWAGRAPLLGLQSLLAAVGLGGWPIVLATSLPWAVRALRRRETRGRLVDDPGRPAALVAFPWLTAALLAGALWQLAVRAAPWELAAAAAWQGAAWLLGASYLHITSNWRPVVAPVWLAPLLAGLATAAAVMAATQAATWLL